ncbi:MAG TPA: DHH family phosphoesterase, partial [Nitrososphaeria archaeon]|nr:DHH family phosphoesterase [Nitrososphaeria archaeon]
MSLDESIYREFLEEAERAAEQIRRLIDEDRSFMVFCHNDADGLSSGAIASIMFLREGARFLTRAVGGIDDILEGLKGLPGKLVPVFTDIGSGYLDEIAKVVGDSPAIILDHHEPVGEAPKNIIQVNPHLHGINGADEISGAGVTYIVAKALNGENVSYSPIAVVGALGDLQDRVDGR